MNDHTNDIYSPDGAAIGRRGVHLDLKGLPPTFERLMALIDVFGQMRFNTVVIEWEDMFPWSFDPLLRHPCHYTPEQVRRLDARCGELEIDLIPLVQSLGHMEFVLQHDRYHALRECPKRADALHPLHEGAADLVLQMVDDVMSLMPRIGHFHLGGDEVWSFGLHPESRAFIEHQGKPSLYMRHMRPIVEELRSRRVRPMLWHDMMMDWPMPSLRQLGQEVDLVIWGYRGTPQMGTHHHGVHVLERMREAGISIWGAAAYKGADGPFRDLPDMQSRLLNHIGWIHAAKSYRLEGLITTGWSRYATGRVQVEPIDACLRELAMASLLFHDGVWPDNGWQKCDQLLEAVGEFERVDHLRRHFGPADAERAEAWSVARQIKEHLAGMQVAPGQPSTGTLQLLWDVFQNLVERTEKRSLLVRGLLTGLVCEPYIDAYSRTWATALRNEAKMIGACFAGMNLDRVSSRRETNLPPARHSMRSRTASRSKA